MSKMTNIRVIALALSMLMIIGLVKGRWLDLETYSTSMISYGVHNISNENPPNYLELRISNSSTPYGGKRCESLYRFLPCADTMPEGVFLMFLYTYLMMLGEEWTHEGSEVLHVWMGDKKLGASVFRVLVALPKIVVFVVPGILSSASDAKNQVLFGVNMYAGSTVITLTLVWGIGIIFSKHKLKKGSSRDSDHQQDSSINCLSLKCKLSFLTDMSVNIDKETGKIAVIMLLSLIPFAFVGLVSFVNTPAMTLFALIVSGVSLLLYFGYQVWNPWIRARSLAYLKQENLRARFFYHVMRPAEADLVDEQGNPNVTCFKKSFEEADTDDDKFISQKELEKLVEKVFDLEKDYISKEYAKAEILIRFDKDKNGKISWEEFEQECTNWLEEGRNEANSSGSAAKSIWNKIRQRAIKKQRSRLSIIELIMPSILKQVLEKNELVTKDGQPNEEKIKGLFSDIDKDKDDVIHKDELKQFIETLNFGIELDRDRVLQALVEDFDGDKNNAVEKNEFVEGFIKWIKEAINHDQSIKNPMEAIAKFHKDSWGEIDIHLKWEKPKAIAYLIFGAAIMITITSAFITSVKQFSNAAHIPFVFTSFVLAPIALKTKMAIKALLKPHVRRNASLTFSEIYDELVMNNLLGLFSLLTILYIKGLSWTYSAEVFTIMIPCAIVGIFAFKRYNYPLWASIPAILLYPVSVYIYYLLANA